MTDRELLELAALAYWNDDIDDVVSIEWSDEDGAIAYTHGDNQDHNGCDVTLLWNPLIFDSEALRLAVKLSIDVLQRFVGGRRAEALAPGGTVKVEYCDEETKAAATRRAIVRAAAEIGKGMK